MTVIEAISKRIGDLMYEKGWSIYKLSRLTGLTPHGIQVILNKSHKDVKLTTLLLLANAFDMSVSELLNCDYFQYENLQIDI